MKNQQLGKNVQLCLVKYFLVYSLSLLMIQDVSSSTDRKCEIKTSCLPSVCQQTNPITVDPDSNITLNCSTITGELVQGMTWNQTLERVTNINSTGLSNLVLQRLNSTKDSDSGPCQCTNVTFTRELSVSVEGSVPVYIHKGIKPRDLECVFSGLPLPRQVSWYMNGELISNGTNGIYHSEDWKGVNLHTKLSFPAGREEQKGFYTCTAMNNISGWSSNASKKIQMKYICPPPKNPTIDYPEILASTFSNVSLTCWIYHDDDFPEDLCWYLNDNPVLFKSGEKYEISKKETSSQCKKQFLLSILNVTENDEGTYSCHWECEDSDSMKAAIDLKVFAQPPTGTTAASESVNTGNHSKASWFSTPAPSGSQKDWLLPIIILSAGCATISFVLFVQFCIRKKWKSSYDIPKSGLNKEDFINRLFISYSSKDFGWVTENLIAVLEKHSIAYSIHSRDFELGRPIVQNMADNVYCSRQVLIVLSENYLASNFCREELHMAVQRGMDSGDSSLILVMINNLRKKKLPTALRNKKLLDFDKHKKKANWEEKILRELGKLNVCV